MCIRDRVSGRDHAYHEHSDHLGSHALSGDRDPYRRHGQIRGYRLVLAAWDTLSLGYKAIKPAPPRVRVIARHTHRRTLRMTHHARNQTGRVLHPGALGSALGFMRRLWPTRGYLATLATDCLLDRGLAPRTRARLDASQRDSDEALASLLERAESHARIAGQRQRARIQSDAISGVVRTSRLRQEQENLLIPLERRANE